MSPKHIIFFPLGTQSIAQVECSSHLTNKCDNGYLLNTYYIQALCFIHSMSFNPYNHHMKYILVSIILPDEKTEVS